LFARLPVFDPAVVPKSHIRTPDDDQVIGSLGHVVIGGKISACAFFQETANKIPVSLKTAGVKTALPKCPNDTNDLTTQSRLSGREGGFHAAGKL
jgi:hypothetical protein